jgi:NDP-sugar pyrophosphorylase family protein
MNKPLTVLILAAGYGRRMGPFGRMINKGLVPYKDKPLISHIIDKFDAGTKFVIACGHMGQQVKDYVGNVHNEKNIIFVDIPNYLEGETGPATTIQCCQQHLRGGFMWVACDTLFEFEYRDKLDHNWIAVCPVDSTIAKDYCWIEREADHITAIKNKDHSKVAVDAFIGLMYAKDDDYLDALISVRAKDTYEAFQAIPLKAHTVRQWKDFGTYEKWEELTHDLTDVSFPKPNELFYHDNNKVIKFWTDSYQADMRLIRANANPNCMPANIKIAGNFLIHDFALGDIVYNQYSLPLFKQMLEWCEHTLWKPVLSDTNHENACTKFYYEKTLERVEQFRVKYSEWSEPHEVNGIEVKRIDEYLKLVGWRLLCTEYEWCFVHGDLHFDNTIYNPATSTFTAIDWRTDFAGDIYGDLYYDLAKMLGGLHLSYKAVKEELIEYEEHNDRAQLTIPSIHNVEEYEEVLRQWVINKGLNWQKVKLLVPIIYLNMSPLHEAPFDKFLVALAQLHFSKIL